MGLDNGIELTVLGVLRRQRRHLIRCRYIGRSLKVVLLCQSFLALLSTCACVWKFTVDSHTSRLLFCFHTLVCSSPMHTYLRLAPVIKCRRFLSFFQRYIVRDISLTWDISRARYFWVCSLAHWNLIRHFEKHETWRTVKIKIIAFWGNNAFLNLTMH